MNDLYEMDADIVAAQSHRRNYVDFVINRFTSIPSDFDLRIHSHPMLQYSVCVKGTLTYSVGGYKVVVPEGQGLFINYDRLHGVDFPEGVTEFYSLLISPYYVTGPIDGMMVLKYCDPYIDRRTLDYFLLSPSKPIEKQIINQIVEIYQLSLRREFAYELDIKALSANIWKNTVLLMREFGTEKENEAPLSPDIERLNTIMQYIHLNYRKKIALADMAARANISAGECCRLFKRITGSSPIEYLNHFRIHQSYNLLRYTSLPILHIAQSVGYPSVNHYLTMFKRFTGCLPRDYRKGFRRSEAAEPLHTVPDNSDDE